jgi:hypothetical protein
MTPRARRRLAVGLVVAAAVGAGAVALVLTLDDMADDGAVLFGDVRLVEGNCQPGSVGDLPPDCRARPVSRELFLYSPALNASEFEGPYYTGGRAATATARSDESGSYRTSVRPGIYSVLVDDDARRYCSTFLEDGSACVVRVRAEGSTRFDVRIDRSAV